MNFYILIKVILYYFFFHRYSKFANYFYIILNHLYLKFHMISYLILLLSFLLHFLLLIIFFVIFLFPLILIDLFYQVNEPLSLITNKPQTKIYKYTQDNFSKTEILITFIFLLRYMLF